MRLGHCESGFGGAISHALNTRQGGKLGLFQHSGDMADIMYGLPEAAGLSVRDINTAQIVAHWPANMIPTR